MTDAEIIKALEICLPLGSDCSLCPLLEETHCYDHLLSEVLDLFNRQKEEIDMQDVRIMNLKHEVEGLNVRNDELNLLNKTASIEAIKEFAERLKKFSQWDIYLPDYVFVDIIDHLVKEMTE